MQRDSNSRLPTTVSDKSNNIDQSVIMDEPVIQCCTGATCEEVAEQPIFPCKGLAAQHRMFICKGLSEQRIFTREQEKFLKDHITRCCKNQVLSVTTLRKMAYEYATKLPDCPYPNSWDNQKMASINWFSKFRVQYPDLKKIVKYKSQNTCVCIMGCHMGQEGKQEFEKLKANILIARVYRYLEREYNYMKTCNDLGLLVNILRRTAEATGVCEQTITSVLDEEKQISAKISEMLEQHLLAPEKCRPKDSKAKKPRQKKEIVTFDQIYAEVKASKAKENKTNEVHENSTIGKTDITCNMDKMTEVNRKPTTVIPNNNLNAAHDCNNDKIIEIDEEPSTVIPNDNPSVDIVSNTDETVELNQQPSVVIPNNNQSSIIESNMDEVIEVNGQPSDVIPKINRSAEFDCNMEEKAEINQQPSTVIPHNSMSADYDSKMAEVNQQPMVMIPDKNLTADFVTNMDKAEEITTHTDKKVAHMQESITTICNHNRSSDFERLQEDAISIKAVKVEIIYDDIEELKPEIETTASDIKNRIIFTENETDRLKPEIESSATDITNRIIFTENEPERSELPPDVKDEVIEDPIPTKRAKIMPSQDAKDEMSTDNTQTDCFKSPNSNLDPTIGIQFENPSDTEDLLPEKPNETNNIIATDIIEPKSFRDLFVVSKGKKRQCAIDAMVAMFPRRKSASHQKLLTRKITAFVDLIRRKKKRHHLSEKQFLIHHKEWLNTKINWFDEENTPSTRLKEFEQWTKNVKKNWNSGFTPPDERGLSHAVPEAPLKIAAYIKKLETENNGSMKINPRPPTQIAVPKKIPGLLRITSPRRLRNSEKAPSISPKNLESLQTNCDTTAI